METRSGVLMDQEPTASRRCIPPAASVPVAPWAATVWLNEPGAPQWPARRMGTCEAGTAEWRPGRRGGAWRSRTRADGIPLTKRNRRGDLLPTRAPSPGILGVHSRASAQLHLTSSQRGRLSSQAIDEVDGVKHDLLDRRTGGVGPCAAAQLRSVAWCDWYRNRCGTS